MSTSRASEIILVLVEEYKMPVTVISKHLCISRQAVYNIMRSRHMPSVHVTQRLASFIEMLMMDINHNDE